MFSSPSVGYDRAITTFSPEGRLYQVEYAIEAVRRGTTAIGCRNDDAVILAVEKRVHKLQESKGMEKIFKIDDHVAVAIAGLTADARVLIDHARVEAQVNILSYDEAISVQEVTRSICDLKQVYTQNAGVRPFGVALLIAGIDPVKGPQLYMTDPSGAYWGYFCQAIGAGAQSAREFLEKEYKPGMSLDELKALPLKALKEVMEETLEPRNCEVVVLDKEEKKIRHLSENEKKELIDSLG
ncbi:MAG: archaeal proteasome endopeptidase complex subunit alpha [Promethearchaeota archaeon]